MIRPAWRTIAKKNELQDGRPFDVLVCGHAVPVDPSTRANVYRRCRACPECAAQVERYRREHS